MQVEVASALVVLQVSVPVPFVALNAPVPPVTVNVPSNVAAAGLVNCPLRLNVPCVVPASNQFFYAPLFVAAPVAALTVAL